MGIFQFDTSFSLPFYALLSMSFLSIVFFIFFHRKHRAIMRLPHLSANVFDKTFNVFNPYSPHRRIIGSYFFALLIIGLQGSLILSLFITAGVLNIGLLLSLVILIVCLSLIISDDVSEIYKNANVFIKVVKNGADLGKGDLTVLFVLKKTLPRLSLYYLSLAIIFLISSVTLPYILPSALWILAQFAGVLTDFAAFMGSYVYAFCIVPLSLVALMLVIQLANKKIKNKLFSFPSSGSEIVLDNTFEYMKTFTGWAAHHEGIAHRPYPNPQDEQERDEKET